ncbi:protein AAR2-like, partial [Trifolium medium]|nr:protein AAR2-like [Trifolium medium]
MQWWKIWVNGRSQGGAMAFGVLLANVVLKVGDIDRLQWLADLGGVYSVKSAYQMFFVGPAFKGIKIKMIPPGTHFVYYSSST